MKCSMPTVARSLLCRRLVLPMILGIGMPWLGVGGCASVPETSQILESSRVLGRRLVTTKPLAPKRTEALVVEGCVIDGFKLVCRVQYAATCVDQVENVYALVDDGDDTGRRESVVADGREYQCGTRPAPNVKVSATHWTSVSMDAKTDSQGQATFDLLVDDLRPPPPKKAWAVVVAGDNNREFPFTPAPKAYSPFDKREQMRAEERAEQRRQLAEQYAPSPLRVAEVMESLKKRDVCAFAVAEKVVDPQSAYEGLTCSDAKGSLFLRCAGRTKVVCVFDGSPRLGGIHQAPACTIAWYDLEHGHHMPFEKPGLIQLKEPCSRSSLRRILTQPIGEWGVRPPRGAIALPNAIPFALGYLFVDKRGLYDSAVASLRPGLELVVLADRFGVARLIAAPPN